MVLKLNDNLINKIIKFPTLTYNSIRLKKTQLYKLNFKQQIDDRHKNHVNGKSNEAMMNGKLHNGDSCINGLSDEVEAIKIVHH